jgi:acyl dehydratase
VPQLFFEDLRPGRVFDGQSRFRVDSAAIKAFAREFDPQPFHLDEAAARESIFGGLAASGWHTAAITMRLLVDDVEIAGGLVGLGLEAMRWPRPTRPGDELRVRVEVLKARESRSRPGFGLVTCRITTLNQDDEVAQELVNTMIVPRRDAPA